MLAAAELPSPNPVPNPNPRSKNINFFGREVTVVLKELTLGLRTLILCEGGQSFWSSSDTKLR